MSAAQTFATWLAACTATHKGPCANNALRVDGATYYLDPNPRQYGNGVMTGHVHKHVKHQGLRNLGPFKILADGSVVKIPAELATLLPGAAAAEQSVEGEEVIS